MDKPDTLEVLNKTRPLRILVLLNLEWNPRLGAVRVYHELAEQWRAMGHEVTHFSLSEAFPHRSRSRVRYAIRQLLFAAKAARFVRRNAARFDVVDALIGSLGASKIQLGFNGLLVARSVGLYRLYDRFEQEANRRWPRRQSGKFIGRIFYRVVRQLHRRASDDALNHADLINVPNESEAECIRRELGSGYRIVVEPYGLTELQRAMFRREALPAVERLKLKKVCFVGMWAARKGAHDWPRIIGKIRQEIPEARFCFFGTMVDSRDIIEQLGPAASAVDCISEYASSELPKLLSDCAVAAFPSYVEGFGLAVLEQLAAAIPTVAFDVPGPANVLKPALTELLVAPGDIDGLASAVTNVLKLQTEEYRQLSSRCSETASAFDWTRIARDTIDSYQERLNELAQRPILFVQPFGVGAAGGGSRILRALLNDAPLRWHSICSSPKRPNPWPNETHIPIRPFWGKIETSRLAMFPKKTRPFFAARFRRRLRNFARSINARAVHAIPHSGIDFADAQTVARELSLPFIISVHDDLGYTAVDEVGPEVREPAMRRAWLESDARFVISESLGREYCRRYGPRPFQIVTDGIVDVKEPRPRQRGSFLQIYFMGLFHLAYERNLRALLDGISVFRRAHGNSIVRVRCRCEYIRPHVLENTDPVEVLPFATEAQVDQDLETADLLYLPMPFGTEHESFARYSISTKMVTYVGSGVPILYHGPATSAAFDLLDRHRAAIVVNSLDPQQIAHALETAANGRAAEIAQNALELARHQFLLTDQRNRFWDTIRRLV